uniref:Uncharacterized protein n=1 Tax=Chlamydomonas leiostraca TaxID=1034604 RepID=A0A7S0RHU2_9CHLO|mmetsp:Transcript_22947/g.58639  ORF Transcript_22947/g.58639 Transcript_22947/m.58639 type:complete len:251 (+) Transcript_22947:180-932(+)
MANTLCLAVAAGFEPCPLGFINVHKDSQGSAMWGPAQRKAASASNCNIEDVTVIGLQYGDGHRVLMAEADRQSVARLAIDNPFIIVKIPADEPPYVQELRSDVADLKAWKLTASKQLNDMGAVVHRLQRENAQYHKILIRILLDSFRTKYLEHLGRTLNDEEKQIWNTTVDKMTEADLHFMGVTRAQAALSKYGQHTAQGEGSRAAHDAGDVPVAYAVTAHSKAGFRAIYRSVYGRDAEEVIEEAEAEQA